MRRYLPLLSIAVLLATLISACGGTSPQPTALPGDSPASAATPGGEPVVISFGVQEYQRQAYEPLIEAFNAENPDIRVQLVSLDEAFRSGSDQSFDPSQIMRRIVSTADTAVSFFARPEDVEAGLLYDLKPLMDADPTFDAADYYPSALQALNVGGGIYMLPDTLRVELLSYNKELWATRGLPEPTPDWTWSDMLAAAEQLAQKRGDEVQTYGLVDFSTPVIVLFGELASAGLNLFASSAEELDLGQPAFVQALERVTALAETGAIYYRQGESVNAVNPEDFRELILDGKAGLWRRELLSGFGGPGQEPANPSFEVGTLPFPPFPAQLFSSNQGFIMSGGTQHPEAAWRWLSYLSRQEISQPFMGPDTAGQVPARKSLAEQTGYWSKLDEGTAAAVRAALDRPTQPASPLSYDQRIFQPVSDALEAVLKGEKAADEAAGDAQADLQEAIVASANQPTPTAESGPVVVATPRPNTAPEGATAIDFSVIGLDSVAIRLAADAFHATDPGVFVNVNSNTSFEGPMSLVTIAASSDCFTWFAPPDTGEITATLDLQPLIDADGNGAALLADYPEALLSPFRGDGKLYGLPLSVQLRTLQYNKDAFDAAGQAPPSASWTMEDFVAAAQKLSGGSGDDRRYGFASFGSGADDARFFLRRLGVSPVAGSGESAAPNFADPEVIGAARLYVELLRDYSPHKRLQGYSRDVTFDSSYFELINEGRVGMWFNYGAMFFGGPRPGYTQAVAPPPLGDTPLDRTDFDVSGMFISAQTEKAEACYAWLKFLGTQLPELGGRYPARTSVVESPEFAGQAPAGAIEVYHAYAEALQRVGLADKFGFDEGQVDLYWFYRALDRALQGEDLERELQAAQEFAEQDLACQRAGGDPASCATQTDPDYDGYRAEAQPAPGS